MAYSDFTLETVLDTFDLLEVNQSLFDQVLPLPISDWLRETLAIGQDFGLRSGTEKARSEFIVVPILLELERRNPNQFAIYSGKSLDIDKDRGLNGECDFILSRGAASRVIQTPIFSLVEAKKQDIDLGLGQCIAQMIGAHLLNQRKGHPLDALFGCVTTGELWQFLKLEPQSPKNQKSETQTIAQQIVIDARPFNLGNELEKILGILQSILDRYR
jgi:hypothetical protein